MLTFATLGMAAYGLYSILAGLADLLMGGAALEWWANLWLVAGGATLVFVAAFVRVSMPGGLALAIAGLLALQSINLHNASHLYGQVVLLPQFARALFAGLLVALAYFGWDSGAGGPLTPDTRPYAPS